MMRTDFYGQIGNKLTVNLVSDPTAPESCESSDVNSVTPP